MKIFILEDDPYRIKQFCEILGPSPVDFVVAVDMNEAVTKFKPPYDYIFLDHDLGERVFVDSADRNTGAEFVRQYGDKLGEAVVIIHSYNPVGRKTMKNLLIEYVHRGIVTEEPFGPTVLNFLKKVIA